MSFASNPTTSLALSTSASTSSLQRSNELDTLMPCYMDETNGGNMSIELDPEESFSPDTFWDDDSGTDNFDGNGSSAMDFLPSTTSYAGSMQGSNFGSYTSFTTNDAFSSTSSFFYDPNDTSTHHDKDAITQKLRDLDQKLAASMKRSEASRARILELKQHRRIKSGTDITNGSNTNSPFGGTVQSVPSVTPTASPNHSARSSISNDAVSDADKTAAFLIESRTSLTAALEQSRLQLSQFSTSALSA